MQYYDIAMIVVLVGTTIFGAWKGMAWQLASLASVVVSFIVARQFAPQVAPMIGNEEPWNLFVAMLVLYLGTSLAIWMAFRLVAGILDRVKLKEFDRQAGALFGAAKGVLLCLAITFFALTLSEDTRKLVLDSRSGYYIAHLIDRATPILPSQVHDVIGPYLSRIDEELSGHTDPESAAPRTATVPGGALER